MPDLHALIPLAEAHAEYDELITGDYGHEDPDTPGGFIGCSIRCTIYDAQRLGLLRSNINRDDHRAVASLLYDGHVWVAGLQDHLHESLPDAERMQWTPRLLRTVIGYEIDWQRVWHRWAGALLMRLVGALLQRLNMFSVRLALWSVERDPGHYAQLVLLLVEQLVLPSEKLLEIQPQEQY